MAQVAGLSGYYHRIFIRITNVVKTFSTKGRVTGGEGSTELPFTPKNKPVIERHPDQEKEPLPEWPDGVNPLTGERGGPSGPEPTRYGDWERKGRVTDF